MLQPLVILPSLLLELWVSNDEVGVSSTNGKLTITCKSKGPIKNTEDRNRDLLTVIECVSHLDGGDFRKDGGRTEK